MRRQSRRSGQGQAPAAALNRLFSTGTQTGPPRTDPPLREATPEIEPVNRDADDDHFRADIRVYRNSYGKSAKWSRSCILRENSGDTGSETVDAG